MYIGTPFMKAIIQDSVKSVDTVSKGSSKKAKSKPHYANSYQAKPHNS